MWQVIRRNDVTIRPHAVQGGLSASEDIRLYCSLGQVAVSSPSVCRFNVE
jgi:hypothetical protein